MLTKVRPRLLSSNVLTQIQRCLSQTVRENKVSVGDGYHINYLQSGEGQRKVLLMPGALGTAKSDFGPQFEGLNKSGQLTLIGWDPPGYGASTPPSRTWPATPNFFFRDADLAVQFMEALGHKEFSILGWSDGAITALVTTGRHPDRISKLVSFAGNAYVAQEDFDMLQKVSDVSKWSQKMREPMEAIYGKDYFPILWQEWLQAYSSLKPNQGDICRSLLQYIQCPTLIIQGAKDALVSKEHPEYLSKNIKNSRVKIYPDGKHNLHFKYSEDFNRTVEQFLLE